MKNQGEILKQVVDVSFRMAKLEIIVDSVQKMQDCINKHSIEIDETNSDLIEAFTAMKPEIDKMNETLLEMKKLFPGVTYDGITKKTHFPVKKL